MKLLSFSRFLPAAWCHFDAISWQDYPDRTESSGKKSPSGNVFLMDLINLMDNRQLNISITGKSI